MRANSFTDTNLLLSSVFVLGLVLLLKLPEFLRFVSNMLADMWWLLRQIR